MITTKESIVGYGRHLQLQSDMYATNLQNHALNLWKFVDYTIKMFCQRNGFPFTQDSDLVDDLRNAIKDPDHLLWTQRSVTLSSIINMIILKVKTWI